MSHSTCFDIWLTQSVVRQFDEQILECVEDEDLTAQQRNELLAWAHNHLSCAYLAIQLDRYRDLTAESVPKHFIRPCRTVIDMISQMLQGGVPLGDDMTFHCPPWVCPQTIAFNRRLSAWLRHRIVLAAQRTRLHTGMELDAIWQSIEGYLVTCALVWFELADSLDVEVPDAETLDATTRDCLDAVRGGRGLVWTPSGAVSSDL